MLVELVERLGHSFDWWSEQPLAFHRWCSYHLQELDRRRGWMTRADHIESAWLTARSFHDPDSLKAERQSHIASAAGSASEVTALERANAMLAEFERGNTLEGLTYRSDLPS